MEKVLEIFKKYNLDFLMDIRAKTSFINPHNYPTLDLMNVILLAEVLNELKDLNKENNKININLNELNKTQLLKHYERNGEDITGLDKVSKEEILKKLGD